ncbi:hypothetical protein VE01_01533 [Pseudogymnoascus verrucosus]|uniref:Uncharacterized protein n=1 Tax=Pseudogymnoascus verrucosus TaxID=342668 RepID=A0A1B8GXA8_9PEZI|nr:uncharacterized protein VE01_01533 [Pseudogymnoascus verrucosus]OBU00468.1 hypothetical protein VE01_01533 [Pseudogymnoascus verrucosus]
MYITEVLRATATDNDRLLKIISETNYGPAALQQSSNYVDNLKKDITAQEKLLRDTKITIAREEAEHREYQTSHVKRLAYRLGGKREKFEQKASKEEQDWVEAVQRGFEVQKKLDLLNQNIAEATKTCAEMETVVATYKQAEYELDSLYKSVFQGPTPDIPGEDQLEGAVYQATTEFNLAQGNVDKGKQVRNLLTSAMKFLYEATQDVESARSNAKMDAFGFDSTFMDIAEANALSRVRQNVSQAEMLVTQARTMDPLIGNIGAVVHAQSHFMSEVLFDNVFSDTKKYNEIKRSQESILKAKNSLQTMIEASTGRLEVAVVESMKARQSLEEKRLQLQQIRAEAYQKAARGELVPVQQGPPPGYQW